MNSKQALLDANIAFDLILSRNRLEKIREILTNFDELFISTSTFALSFYLLLKSGITKKEIISYLENYKILSFSELHCFIACRIAKNTQDVEDCMELELAREYKLALITADKEFVEKYSYSGFVFVK